MPEMFGYKKNTYKHRERRTSKLYLSLEESMALSRFLLPKKHHGHTVSALISILASFFSGVELEVLGTVLLCKICCLSKQTSLDSAMRKMINTQYVS